MPSIYFGTVTKKKNSTLQPTLTQSYDCIYKEETSIDTPTFIIQDASFDISYNYAKWDNNYYFIDDIKSLSLDMWEVTCALDVLATYKSEITGSTQFVLYSSQSGGAWVEDTRLVNAANAIVGTASNTVTLFDPTAGTYVMTAIGRNGCDLYGLTYSEIAALIANVSTYRSDMVNDIITSLPHSLTGNTVEQNLENVVKSLIETGTLGNSYLDAPACIRSCIWVPFYPGPFTKTFANSLYLGQYDTGVANVRVLDPKPATGGPVSVSIPWHYSDWRRATCEAVYLYLPLVGFIDIPANEIVNETALSVSWSATIADGSVCYIVKAGNQIIGTFSGSAAVNYPIGISQQSNVGAIPQAIVSGNNSWFREAIKAAAGNRFNMWYNTANLIETMMGDSIGVASAAVDAVQQAKGHHNTCIGGIGGGAGAGLPLSLTCITVCHPTVVDPSDMLATMGVPTMKPISLSTLSGYCQCSNAHVAAPAQASELNALDAYLNTGFYIE